MMIWQIRRRLFVHENDGKFCIYISYVSLSFYSHTNSFRAQEDIRIRLHIWINGKVHNKIRLIFGSVQSLTVLNFIIELIIYEYEWNKFNNNTIYIFGDESIITFHVL